MVFFSIEAQFIYPGSIWFALCEPIWPDFSPKATHKLTFCVFFYPFFAAAVRIPFSIVLRDWLGWSEIHRIVSQKQLRDPGNEDGDRIRPNNVETINVKPTVNTENVRRQCCNQWTPPPC